MPRIISTLSITILGCLMLSSCGRSGPLQLPQHQSHTTYLNKKNKENISITKKYSHPLKK